jgi:Calx-beta domain-containing protein
MRLVGSRIVVALAMGATLVLMAAPALAACHVASFVGDPYSISESAGTVTITVSNGAGAPPGGSIKYSTVDGAAKAGQDFTATTGTLTFGAGQTERSFNVPILPDASDEPNETFGVKLSEGTGCFTSWPNDPVNVTIQDDDAPAPQPTQTQTQRPRTTPTPTRTSTPTPTPTLTPTPTPTTPSPSPTQTAVAIPDQNDEGIPPGAIAGIVAGVVALGGGAAYFIRRRLLS